MEQTLPGGASAAEQAEHTEQTEHTEHAEQTEQTEQTDKRGADGAPERRDEFEKLIRGEYKREFDERVKRIIDKRFRETKELKERAEQLKPVMDALKAKYGETDAQALAERVKAPEAEPERAQAPEKPQAERLTDENARLRADNQLMAREMRARDTVKRWREDAETAKQAYPEFSLERELNQPAFSKLLRAGVDVKTAYEVTHRDELLGGAMRYTAEKIREKTVSDILARGARPHENGDIGRGASRVKPPKVGDMTLKQREEIERRCLSGEKVYFD